MAGTVLAAAAVLCGNHVATVSATSKASLSRGSFAQEHFKAAADSLGFSFSFSADMSLAAPGCPLGPAMTFCNQIPGTTSQAVPFTISFGSAASTVSIALAAVPGLSANFNAADFTISNNTCTGNFAANASCSFDLAFSPTMLGLREAGLTINGTAFANVAGTGASLVIEPPTPPSCPGPGLPGDFFLYCPQTVGTASGPETFTLISANAITGLNIAFAGIPGLLGRFNASDFTIESTTCGPSLGANASCTLAVAFTPTAAGPRSALLTATDSEGDTVSLYLSGTTSAALVFSQPTTGECRLRLFSFCNEPQGGTTAPITYTLENNSGTQVTGLAITPPVPTVPPTLPPTNFTVQSTTCTPTLAAGASCTLNVTFTPQSTGLILGQVVVTDGQGDIAGLSLAGTGDDYELSLASSQSMEVTVVQGFIATLQAQVTADSVFGASGEMVMLACPGTLPKSSTCSFTPCPLTVAPNSTASFSIMIGTSSTLGTIPPVTNPCGGTALSSQTLRQPVLAIYVPRETPRYSGRFPALLLMAAGCPIALTLVSTRGGRRKRVPLILAVLALTTLLLAGCGSSGVSGIATPIGTYTLTITGNALDASGNPLNASRAVSFTIDVVAAGT
jgi:hypothetical protein